MDHRNTPDIDTHSVSEAELTRLPRQITPQDVDTRWPFRAGYPRLLRPSVVSMPIEEAEKPISNADLDGLRSRIAEILISYDLSRYKSITPLPEVVYRRQKFGTYGLARVLIHCEYDKDTSYSKKWAQAVVEIYAETQSVVKVDCLVGVEMVHLVSMNAQLCTLPTTISQELSTNWEIGRNYCQKILDLFQGPHPMFQAMLPIGRCTIRRTGAFNDGPPTYELSAVIFFDALNAEDELWDYLEGQIRSVLPSEIGIEIRQRSGPFFFSPPYFPKNDMKALIPSPEEFARPPRFGCDVAVQGGGSAGTMGGYVVTEDENGQRATYGVTNAHVALQGYEKRVYASADTGIRMQPPSEVSRSKAKLQLLKNIQELEGTIQQKKDLVDAWELEDPDLCQGEKEFVKSHQSDLEYLPEKKP